MERITDIKDIVNKTIEKVEHDDDEVMILYFTDKTMIFLEAEGADFNANYYITTARNFSDVVKVKYGLITQEEFDKNMDANTKEHIERSERENRAQYERLKAKYEKEV